MNNFTFSIPTKIHFGKGQITHLSELTESGVNVLLVYGGGSIKRNGLYETAINLLTESGLKISELSGVEPNPRIQTVRRGVELCKSHSIDMVLAIGGGSTIDCAKIVAAGAKYDGDPWDLVINPSLITDALPIYSVLTLAATGSEMDVFAVISDLDKNEKLGTFSPLIRPKMSIMDPEYTYSVSAKQTSAGTADIMSHVLENYFTNVSNADIQAKFAEGLLKCLIKYGPIALENPCDYDARANLMWAGSHAINGLISLGAEVSWCVHPIEHELSAFYDITHGEGLAIITPHWMRYVLNKNTVKKFAEYGHNVWGISGQNEFEIANAAIESTEQFFRKMKLPSTLSDVGITDESKFQIMAEKAAIKCKNSFVPLSANDIISILRAAK